MFLLDIFVANSSILAFVLAQFQMEKERNKWQKGEILVMRENAFSHSFCTQN